MCPVCSEVIDEKSCPTCIGLYSLDSVKGQKHLILVDGEFSSLEGLEGIHYLRLEKCPWVTSLEYVKGVQHLELEDEPLITTLEPVKGVKYLVLRNCPLITSLVEGVEHLELVECPLIRTLGQAEKSVRYLEVRKCPLLKLDPEIWHSSCVEPVRQLFLENCPELASSGMVVKEP